MEQKDIKRILNNAENELKICFNYLMDFKHGRFVNGEVILEFQPRLANCLYSTMQEYQKLCQKERTYISDKDNYTKKEFSEIMSSLSKYKNALKQIIDIGKAMGDGFAWYFYQSSLNELDKHMEHKGTGLFPAGIGGRGEIQFIKHNQNIGGLFTLYHSITSMLKVGDFSLCTLDGEVLGIGELKSKQKDNKLSVKAYLTSKVDIDVKFQASNSDKPVDFDRLKRQLKQQDSLLEERNSERNANIMADYQYDLIEQALNKEEKTAISDDKTMFAICDIRELKLEDLLLKDEHELDDEFKSDAIQAAAKQIINDDYKENGFRICEINLNMTPFRKPIVWWNLDEYIIEMIIFKKLQIFTVVNTGAFYYLLEKQGYIVEKSIKEKEGFEIYKEENKGRICFKEPTMLLDLIYHNFIRMTTVIETINQTISDFAQDADKEKMELVLHLHQHTFGKPSR